MRDVANSNPVPESSIEMMNGIRVAMKEQRRRLGISLGELDRRLARVSGAKSYTGYASLLESGKIAFPGMNTITRWALALEMDFTVTFSARNDEPPVGIASTKQQATRIPTQRLGSTELHLQTARR